MEDNIEGVEGNPSEENKASSTPTDSGTNSAKTVEVDKTGEIDKLTTIINSVVTVFETEVKLLRKRVYIFGGIAIVIALAIIYMYYLVIIGYPNLLPDFKDGNLRAWYEISLRIMFVSFFISMVVFCLRMMRNYLGLFEQLRHKLTIINSMPTLVYGSGDNELFKSSYTKVVDLLIQLVNIEDMVKNSEFDSNKNALELIKGLIKKERE